MVRPSSLGPVLVPALPHGYLVRHFRSGDQRAYEHLFHLAFEDDDRFAEIRQETLPGGFLLIEDLSNGRLVSSCLAMRGEGRGQLGWLVTDPEHSRKGLATIVSALATNCLVETYATPFLGTEDFRIPAIAIYLRLGWQPDFYAPGMEERWRAIGDQLVKSP